MDIKYSSSLLVVNFIAFILYAVYLYKKKAFEMNPKRLTRQYLFWAAIIIPFSFFITTGIISWHDKSLRLDSTGFDNFLSISKLPLALLSLSLPLGVIVNNIHRTIQTEKQIEEAERKNKADAFYAHRKNTIDVLDNLPFSDLHTGLESIKLEFHNTYSVYRLLYPKASSESGIIDGSTKIIDDVLILWEEFDNLISSSSQRDEFEELNSLLDLQHHLDKIHKKLQLKKHITKYHFEKMAWQSDSADSADSADKSCMFSLKFQNVFFFEEAIQTYIDATLHIADVIGASYVKERIDKLNNLKNFSLDNGTKYPNWYLTTPSALPVLRQ